jgi:chromosome segregation ATPase
MSQFDEITTSISFFSALLGIKPSITLPLMEVSRRVLNEANAKTEEHNNKLKPGVDAAIAKRDAAEEVSNRVHGELQDVRLRIKSLDTNIETVKQSIKRLREERDDTGDASLTEQIKEKWKKIHEIEAEQSELHAKCGEITKQLVIANAAYLRAEDEYSVVMNKKQGIVQAVLGAIVSATNNGFVTPDADTTTKPADFV